VAPHLCPGTELTRIPKNIPQVVKRQAQATMAACGRNGMATAAAAVVAAVAMVGSQLAMHDADV
jgi:hypothetical protein